MLTNSWITSPRRQFDDDFTAQAVRLFLDEGNTVGAVARDLDLTETALRGWVKRTQADRTNGRTGLTTAEREELARLREREPDSAGRTGDPKKLVLHGLAVPPVAPETLEGAPDGTVRHGDPSAGELCGRERPSRCQPSPISATGA